MKIIDIRELPDGSVDADVKFTDDEVTLLLNYAINNLLKEHIAESAAQTSGPREVILSEYFVKSR